MDVKYNLPGVFENNPLRIVNGSLWTIPYEIVCYFGVLILSLIGFQKTRTWVLIAFALVAIGASFLPIHTDSPALIVFHLDLFSLLRFGLYFAGGALIYLFCDVIKQDWRMFAVCLVALVAGILFKNALLISFFVFPYIIIYLARIPSLLSGFAKYGDFSYGMYLYAFPVQQIILSFSGKMPVIPMFLYSVFFTLPFAYLSWRFVERPALSYKTLRLSRSTTATPK